MAAHASAPRRFLVPEVVQTSAMDCGPACLKCLLEGFGVRVSYGRLREACQTDVDGTSIDTLEEVAGQLGLEAEQIMLPIDHVLLSEARALPAIAVVRLPNGLTHFVIIWRAHGWFVQVMDPATGRRWPVRRQFLDELLVHRLPVPARAWRDWAGSGEFLRPLFRRLKETGVDRATADRLVHSAAADAGWRSLAMLDAAVRMVASIVRSGGLPRGASAGRLIGSLIEQAAGVDQVIPPAYWSVRPVEGGAGADEQLLLRGAVLVRVKGRREPAESSADAVERARALPPDLVAALAEAPSRPGLELLRRLRADGVFTPIVIALAWLLAAAGVVMEALLFRGVIELGRVLLPGEQRLMLMALLALLVTANFLAQFSIMSGVLRFGRGLDVRLRVAFLEKLPRIGDRYFHSRLTSDMAERSHSAHQLRALPALGSELMRWAFTLLLTTLGIIWLDPGAAPLALLAAGCAIGVPFFAQPALAERDLRVRNHVGGLSRFYLDSLLGLVAVRTHGAERAVRREHESLLVEWARARLGLQRTLVTVEGLQSLLGFGLAAWLLLDHLARTGDIGGALLLTYWALNLPVLGQEITLLARQYPQHKNVTLRLLEPLGAPEESRADAPAAARSASAAELPRGVGVALESVTVRAGGHTILADIDLTIQPGSHLAIVGPSGAGKSSLVGILLGWHRPAAGAVRVDGDRLDASGLERLRRETAWVDPSVQLWNRSLLDNLHYGAPADSGISLAQVLDEADLRAVLERLPGGLQTQLGEGGALLSGGEGQRVRLGRGLARSDARLVILDEPFRGLSRMQRRELLARARRLWRDATLLCVTHDVGDTLDFERVLVMEHGRVLEDGSPSVLADKASSRFRAMLEAEGDVRGRLWSRGAWQRLWLERGLLTSDGRENSA
jgi:ATP-binding cassette subfamily B protein